MRRTSWGVTTLLIGGCYLLAGCATTINKPGTAPQPCKERLGSFAAVEIEHVSLAPGWEGSSSNRRAARKIDELLVASMLNVFPGMKVVDKATGKATVKTLAIRPVIKEIKFIGFMGRVWVGAMAGSSAVLMQVDFVDKATGTVLANPQFYRSSNAWAGSMAAGVTDNLMLSHIVLDITTYTAGNR